jgi:hypothetical protein
MSLFLCLGRPEIPHEPTTVTRVDLPVAPPTAPGLAPVLKAARRGAEAVWRTSEERGLEVGDIRIGGPSDAAVAVAMVAVLRGMFGLDLPLYMPRRPESPPPPSVGGMVSEHVYDLGDPIKVGELTLDGVELRERLRGTSANLSSLPLPDKHIDTALLCFGDPAIPITGGAAIGGAGQPLRVDVPVTIPPTGQRLAPGDHPYGWDLLLGGALFDRRDAVLKAYEARKVVVGLPDHAGLAVTIAAVLRRFFYAQPTLIGWATAGPTRHYDLDEVLDPATAEAQGKALRERLEAGETAKS